MHDDPVADVITRLDVPAVPSAEFAERLWSRLEGDLADHDGGLPKRLSARPTPIVVLSTAAACLLLVAISAVVLRDTPSARRVVTEPSTGSTTTVPDALAPVMSNNATRVTPEKIVTDGGRPLGARNGGGTSSSPGAVPTTAPTVLAPGQATPVPAGDQWVAFRRDVNGDRSVWIMKLDGSGARRVSGGTMPSWSPDARELAIVDGGELRVVDVETGKQRSIALGTPGVPRDPAWSPDGQTIAVQVSKPDALGGCTVGPCSNEIWLVAADGSSPRLLRNGASPSWSPDGRRIVFTDATGFCGDETSHCYGTLGLVGVDGSGLDFPGQLVAQPAFSPDGRQIVYQREYQFDTDIIEVTDADGNNPKTVVGGATGNRWTPTWTPDGRIVYCSAYTNGCALRVINADGTGRSDYIGGEDMKFDEYPSVVRRAAG